MRVRALLDLGRRTARGQGLGNLGIRHPESVSHNLVFYPSTYGVKTWHYKSTIFCGVFNGAHKIRSGRELPRNWHTLLLGWGPTPCQMCHTRRGFNVSTLPQAYLRSSLIGHSFRILHCPNRIQRRSLISFVRVVKDLKRNAWIHCLVAVRVCFKVKVERTVASHLPSTTLCYLNTKI